MKMSRVPTSLTAACIAKFGANVLVKTGTQVPTKGEGTVPAPSQVIIAGVFRTRTRLAVAASAARARRDYRLKGLAVSATP